jgi:hypothetical protein
VKNKNIVKRFSFSDEERRKLENIQIGIINAEATSDGLHIYKNALLAGVYKRCGIDGEPKKGYSKSIRYNLRENLIEYTEAFIEKKDGKN